MKSPVRDGPPRPPTGVQETGAAARASLHFPGLIQPDRRTPSHHPDRVKRRSLRGPRMHRVRRSRPVLARPGTQSRGALSSLGFSCDRGFRPRAGPTAAELEAVLLEAKLSVPHRRTGSVSRAALIEAARARGCRVVGVTAPAGYGKSTLLAEWAETGRSPGRLGVVGPVG